MAEHLATITWTRGTDDFLDKRYHRAHRWQFDGGATVAASSSPHVVPLPYSDAAAVDPEEAYVAALSSCHMLWFMDFASRAGYRLNSYTDAAVGTMASISGQQARCARASKALSSAPPALVFTSIRPKP